MIKPTDEALDDGWKARVEAGLRITQGVMFDDLMTMPLGYVLTLEGRNQDLFDALTQCRQILDNLQDRQLLASSALGGHLTIDNRYEIAIADAALAKARGETT